MNRNEAAESVNKTLEAFRNKGFGGITFHMLGELEQVYDYLKLEDKTPKESRLREEGVKREVYIPPVEQEESSDRVIIPIAEYPVKGRKRIPMHERPSKSEMTKKEWESLPHNVRTFIRKRDAKPLPSTLEKCLAALGMEGSYNKGYPSPYSVRSTEGLFDRERFFSSRKRLNAFIEVMKHRKEKNLAALNNMDITSLRSLVALCPEYSYSNAYKDIAVMSKGMSRAAIAASWAKEEDEAPLSVA
jgi:hypothetical protein